MRIILNGEARDCVAGTVEQVLEEAGFGDAVVATALNGRFVPVAERASTPIAEGDEVEVLAPMQGG